MKNWKTLRTDVFCCCRPSSCWPPWSSCRSAARFYSSFTAFRLTKPETLLHLRRLPQLRQRILHRSGNSGSPSAAPCVLLTVALNLEMLLGLGLAHAGQEGDARASACCARVMMFPMMFSPVLVGFQFKFMFNDNIGLVNNALQALGLTDQAIPWLIDGNLALFSIIIAEVWSSTSVFAILILAGLLAMPKEPIEAARVDGCTPLADLPLCHLALHDALRLHRHDHPLARRGARL